MPDNPQQEVYQCSLRQAWPPVSPYPEIPVPPCTSPTVYHHPSPDMPPCIQGVVQHSPHPGVPCRAQDSLLLYPQDTLQQEPSTRVQDSAKHALPTNTQASVRVPPQHQVQPCTKRGVQLCTL